MYFLLNPKNTMERKQNNNVIHVFFIFMENRFLFHKIHLDHNFLSIHSSQLFSTSPISYIHTSLSFPLQKTPGHQETIAKQEKTKYIKRSEQPSYWIWIRKPNWKKSVQRTGNVIHVSFIFMENRFLFHKILPDNNFLSIHSS